VIAFTAEKYFSYRGGAAMGKRTVVKEESGARIYPKFRREIEAISQDKIQGPVVRYYRERFPGAEVEKIKRRRGR